MNAPPQGIFPCGDRTKGNVMLLSKLHHALSEHRGSHPRRGVDFYESLYADYLGNVFSDNIPQRKFLVFATQQMKEQTIGAGARVDGIDYVNRIVYELKPNNPRAIRRGMKQLDRYLDILGADNWAGVLMLYKNFWRQSMIKQEFIEEIRAPLKKYGFQKKGAYWFKKCNDIIFCINVQGSQWNKDNYYFAIGGAEYKGTSE